MPLLSFSDITTQYAVPNFADRKKKKKGESDSNVSSFPEIMIFSYFFNVDVTYEVTVLKYCFYVGLVHYSVLILLQHYSLLSLIINIDCMLVCEQVKWPSVSDSRRST